MAGKILIVEDNKKNRLLLKDILMYYGYEVIEAVNGEEGVRLAIEHKPDLILMDIQMPVMNGFRAGEALKENPDTKHIKIVAVTSFAMKGDREKILKAGFDGYIAKPIDTKQLPEIVKELTGLRRMG